ncbi:MAG: alanine racemase [Acholeplasmataceae bacterium]
MSKIYRPTYAKINLDHLDHNYSYVQQLNPNKTIIPVIKANAYGHGAIKIMQYLYEKGVRIFAVSLLEEAIELRKVNKDIKILMMGPILKDQFKVAETYEIDITAYNEEIIKDLLKSNYKLNIHLKIDTGMHRYGINDELQILSVIDDMNRHQKLHLEGLYTHFSTANEDYDYYLMQLSRFKSILSKIKEKPHMIHISNSSSSIKYEKDYDFTTHMRLGISLYGLSLDSPKPPLKPVMSLISHVIDIKSLKKGDKVGYGASYEANHDEKIAIIPLGYADGWLRSNKNAYVEINHKTYQTIGIICMDAMFVKVDDSIKIGDQVTLFGGLVKTDDVAKKQKTIVYEVCTNISYRVPRIYIKGE